MNYQDFTIDCTGDVCIGDIIYFVENVFVGSYRKPKYLGDRDIFAKVVGDSYGDKKQQHTFIIEVLASGGVDALAVGTRTTRKGRNVYKNGTKRLSWGDETQRHAVLDEKHDRGAVARTDREIRRGF